MDHTFQFSCPSCGALLQAVLKDNLTSVQCGECLDVFDVQKPSIAPGAGGISQPICTCANPSGESNGSMQMAPPAGSMAMVEEPAAKRSRMDEPSGEQPVDAGDATQHQPVSVAAMAEDDSAMNLESSLQSCTAHRERILQMLAEEPDNQNLMDLRDQLTNAINQLQGTKNMVQRAQSSRQPGMMPSVGPDGMRNKAHSSRKNKPQRCSICGGIGHKSRTCTMAMQQQAAQQPNAQQVQWAAAAPQCIPTSCDGAQMYVPVPPGGCGYMIAAQPGQQGLPMGAGMPICCGGQPMCMPTMSAEGVPVEVAAQPSAEASAVAPAGGEAVAEVAAEAPAEQVAAESAGEVVASEVMAEEAAPEPVAAPEAEAAEAIAAGGEES